MVQLTTKVSSLFLVSCVGSVSIVCNTASAHCFSAMLLKNPLFDRSDYGSTVTGEGHVQDFARIGGGYTLLDDESTLSKSICETETSTMCPFGWAYYSDNGSEGVDSCVFIATVVALSWSAANWSCPVGSHLLTLKSSNYTSGLLPFSTSLYHGAGQKMYIGCRFVCRLSVGIVCCL